MRFGIEAEYAVLGPSGELVDWTHPSAPQLQAMVDRLPDYDDPDLTRGDLAIKWTRWYVEGDERFDITGGFLRCVPKGLETRTPIRPGIDAAMRSLTEQTTQLQHAAGEHGLGLGAIGFHPFAGYRPEPPYNAWELAMRDEHPEYAAAEVYMCSFGPDLNLSHPEWDAAEVLRRAARLARCAPWLVAFALNSPFAGGRRRPWYSARTALRAGRRPTVRVFLERPEADPPAVAGLAVQAARIPHEVGRIEFKAFDAIADLARLGSLLALVAGVCLADRDPATAAPQGTDDLVAALRQVARLGLDGDGGDGERVRQGCAAVLAAAADGLAGLPEQGLLEALRRDLAARRVPAQLLLADHARTGRITVPPLRLP
jgi:gamma-glutamyl:cysteine ligase YbdK (ATP-grasp superfamily)